MFGSRAGERSIDLSRSVIWTYGGKNSNIRLITRAALLFGRPPESCQNNTKLERSNTSLRVAPLVRGGKSSGYSRLLLPPSIHGPSIEIPAGAVDPWFNNG
jgi:hypothetical protein